MDINIVYIYIIYNIIYLFNVDAYKVNEHQITITKMKSIKEILYNNIKNFLSYLILFPIQPVLIIIDIFNIVINIYFGVCLLGLLTTISKLYGHFF